MTDITKHDIFCVSIDELARKIVRNILHTKSDCTFGTRLQALRKEKKITQTEMSDLLGVQKRVYQSYECEKVKPDYNNLIIIADVLDVSLDYLCGRNNCCDFYGCKNCASQKNPNTIY